VTGRRRSRTRRRCTTGALLLDVPAVVTEQYPQGLGMERAGAIVTSVETALFELCERAGTAEFRVIQGLVK
jgi:hypothetical protein